MRQISNSDYGLMLRLLKYLASLKGTSLKDSEAARKAGLLVRKLERKNLEIES